MSALELDSIQFLRVAAEAGCQSVSVFTHDSFGGYPVITRDNKYAFKRVLQDTGLAVASADAFMLLPNTRLQSFISALELGADIGAKRSTVLLFDGDEQRVIDNLSQLYERAGKLGLSVAIEFMPLAPAWKTIEETATLIEKVGSSILGISVDVLHFVRSGGKPADIMALRPERIFCMQLCDSQDLSVTENYAEEAISGRLMPGEGRFPLKEIIDALAPNMPIELEIPQSGHLSACERINDAVAAARRIL
jgi:sugar phosphate isomerase/epimerase